MGAHVGGRDNIGAVLCRATLGQVGIFVGACVVRRKTRSAGSREVVCLSTSRLPTGVGNVGICRDVACDFKVAKTRCAIVCVFIKLARKRPLGYGWTTVGLLSDVRACLVG